MRAAERHPEWVVCHQVTRGTSGPLVRCPQRGIVLSGDCLGCRFLTTSSVERTAGPWCELPPPALSPAAERPLQVPADAPPSRRLPWPFDLPVLMPVGPGVGAEPAVRPPAAVPSVRTIGT